MSSAIGHYGYSLKEWKEGVHQPVSDFGKRPPPGKDLPAALIADRLLFAKDFRQAAQAAIQVADRSKLISLAQDIWWMSLCISLHLGLWREGEMLDTLVNTIQESGAAFRAPVLKNYTKLLGPLLDPLRFSPTVKPNPPLKSHGAMVTKKPKTAPTDAQIADADTVSKIVAKTIPQPFAYPGGATPFTFIWSLVESLKNKETAYTTSFNGMIAAWTDVALSPPVPSAPLKAAAPSAPSVPSAPSGAPAPAPMDTQASRKRGGMEAQSVFDGFTANPSGKAVWSKEDTNHALRASLDIAKGNHGGSTSAIIAAFETRWLEIEAKALMVTGSSDKTNGEKLENIRAAIEAFYIEVARRTTTPPVNASGTAPASPSPKQATTTATASSSPKQAKTANANAKIGTELFGSDDEDDDVPPPPIASALADQMEKQLSIKAPVPIKAPLSDDAAVF
jgi:hypothetical protein